MWKVDINGLSPEINQFVYLFYNYYTGKRYIKFNGIKIENSETISQITMIANHTEKFSFSIANSVLVIIISYRSFYSYNIRLYCDGIFIPEITHMDSNPYDSLYINDYNYVIIRDKISRKNRKDSSKTLKYDVTLYDSTNNKLCMTKTYNDFVQLYHNLETYCRDKHISIRIRHHPISIWTTFIYSKKRKQKKLRDSIDAFINEILFNPKLINNPLIHTFFNPLSMHDQQFLQKYIKNCEIPIYRICSNEIIITTFISNSHIGILLDYNIDKHCAYISGFESNSTGSSNKLFSKNYILCRGDILYTINGKNVFQFTTQEIKHILKHESYPCQLKFIRQRKSCISSFPSYLPICTLPCHSKRKHSFSTSLSY